MRQQRPEASSHGDCSWGWAPAHRSSGLLGTLTSGPPGMLLSPSAPLPVINPRPVGVDGCHASLSPIFRVPSAPPTLLNTATHSCHGAPPSRCPARRSPDTHCAHALTLVHLGRGATSSDGNFLTTSSESTPLSAKITASPHSALFPP